MGKLKPKPISKQVTNKFCHKVEAITKFPKICILNTVFETKLQYLVFSTTTPQHLVSVCYVRWWNEKMMKVWNWYQNCLSVHPVKTQAISSAILWGVGYLSAQYITHSAAKKPLQLSVCNNPFPFLIYQFLYCCYVNKYCNVVEVFTCFGFPIACFYTC